MTKTTEQKREIYDGRLPVKDVTFVLRGGGYLTLSLPNKTVTALLEGGLTRDADLRLVFSSPDPAIGATRLLTHETTMADVMAGRFYLHLDDVVAIHAPVN